MLLSLSLYPTVTKLPFINMQAVITQLHYYSRNCLSQGHPLADKMATWNDCRDFYNICTSAHSHFFLASAYMGRFISRLDYVGLVSLMSINFHSNIFKTELLVRVYSRAGC